MRLGIRGKIASVILICMVPVLVLGVLLTHQQDQARRNLVRLTQQDAARALASDVSTFIDNTVHAERAAGSAVESQPYPVIGIVQLLASIRAYDPSFLWLGLVLPDGHVEASDPAGDPYANVATRRGFAAVLSGAPWAPGDVRTRDGRPELEVATGINEGRRLAAVVDGIVDLTGVRPVLPTALAPDMDGIIVDDTGRIVLDLRRPGRSAGSLASLHAVQAALRGEPQTIEGYREAGAQAHEVGAAVPIADLRWAAVVLEPETSALQSVRQAAQEELGWVFAAVGLGIFLAWVLGAELSAPILALAKGARAIGRGEVGYRVRLRRTDELGELGAAFDEMSERLARSLAEINALQSVSDAALSTVRLDELLATLVQQIASALRADGGTVWFVDDATGDLVAPMGSARGAARTGRLPRGEGLAGRVADGGRALVLSGEDAFRALDPRLLAQGVRAAASVPLRVGGRVIGVMEIISHTEREFRAQDVRLIEAFADRVALAVDNARAYERQQEIAGIIQQALLPTPSVRLPGLAMAGRYVPSREVGGDFYAALPLGQGKVGLAIADVSGKGIRAAALSARARYLLEAFALEGRSSEAVLGQMNAVLTRDAASDLLVSLFYGVIDPDAGTLRCTSAGHPPPLLLRAGALAPEALGVPGLLLGVDAGARYSAIEVRVGPGDLLVLFTDGITEARRGAGEEFGDHRLGDYMVELRDAQPEDIADEVMRAVAQWSGDSPKDDQALVVVRVLPWGTNVPGGRIGGGTVPTHTA